MTKCSGCKIIRHNYNMYSSLIFPLEEVRKYKLEELMKNNIILNENQINLKVKSLNENKVDIKDCFDYYQKVETFSGDNAMYCATCNNQLDATNQTVLFSLPKILIIILSRGRGNQFKVKIKFGENLDLNNYSKNGGYYELISFITHLGECDSTGHFIAACKSPIDHQWYRYNDELVTRVYDINKEILDFGLPYILFYKKK